MDEKLFINKELSNLNFNYRVLMQAKNDKVPLFEKFNFLQIFIENLDRFFMTKITTNHEMKKMDKKTYLNSKKNLDMIFKKTKKLIKIKDSIYLDLMSKIKIKYIENININQLSKHEYEYVEAIFKDTILPLISPQIIDNHHPFPFLKNKNLYIYVSLLSKKKNIIKTGIIPASGYFNRLIILPKNSTRCVSTIAADDKIRFILVEDLIFHFSNHLFSKYKIISKAIFKVTRKADMELNNEFETSNLDMKQLMSNLLKKRHNLSPVKLDISAKSENIDSICDYLTKKLSLTKEQVFINKSPLDISFFSKLINSLDKYNNLNSFYPTLIPQKTNTISSSSIINEVLKNDILLIYPFESMALFTKLLDQAAEDKDVVSIKITLYRIAVNSQIVSILKKAADNGKDVLVVVELKANFDEQNNIEWATALEESFCKVIYGLEDYKVHAKILLITKKENDKITYISQIGTGNYNEITSKSYTDISYITSDQNIGSDILDLFNNLCTGTIQESASKILTSPVIFKPKFLELIDDEIKIAQNNKEAKIIIKCNSLSDMDIMLKLIEASKAGVKIKLIIRGICCLLPGIKGFTENIEVISIVGRFLEHSRIFSFGTNTRKKIYISSADLMTRNTTKRVEVICPIENENLKQKLSSILELYINDNISSSKLLPTGEYEKISQSDYQQICDCQNPASYENL